MAWLAQQERGPMHVFRTERQAELYVSGQVRKALAGGARSEPVWVIWQMDEGDRHDVSE
jgi:hypothetical protein